MGRRKIEHVTSDGQRWLTNTLSTTDGVICSGFLFGLIAALGAVEKGADDKPVLSAILPAITLELRDPRMVEIIRTLCAGLNKQEGSTILPVDFEAEFSGNYGTLIEIVAWLVDANFRSFLAGKNALENIMRQLKPGRAKAPPTPDNSTGRSGDPSSPASAA